MEAQLSTQLHPAVMSIGCSNGIPRSFNEYVRLRLVLADGSHRLTALKVTSSKPANPKAPSTEDLSRLAPFERAFRDVLEAQKRHGFDCEALVEAFAPLLKEVKYLQGIRAYTVDLSGTALWELPSDNDNPTNVLGFAGKVELLEVPEDLRKLHEELRELHLNVSALAVLPEWLGEFALLEALLLDGADNADDGGVLNSSLRVLPEVLGDLQALKTLTLEGFGALKALPASITQLTSLETLCIEKCPALELPASICALTALRTLKLHSLPELLTLPASITAISALTALTELSLIDCTIADVSPLIECLTALRSLIFLSKTSFDLPCPTCDQLLSFERAFKKNFGCPNCKGIFHSADGQYIGHLNVDGAHQTPIFLSPDELAMRATDEHGTFDHNQKEVYSSCRQRCCREFRQLACSLPVLRLLQHLELSVGDGGGSDRTPVDEDDVLALGRSLKAWPLPLLDLDVTQTGPFMYSDDYSPIGLHQCWQALALPSEAADWDDSEILQFWLMQQQKVAAFASGLHARLGAASLVWSLNDVALVLIADEVMGGWSLRKMWQRDRLARESESQSGPASRRKLTALP